MGQLEQLRRLQAEAEQLEALRAQYMAQAAQQGEAEEEAEEEAEAVSLPVKKEKQASILSFFKKEQKG
jgi:acyl-[acyl carrier protein]--UDP-N-acetylglucosamine O-acyltransferase